MKKIIILSFILSTIPFLSNASVLKLGNYTITYSNPSQFTGAITGFCTTEKIRDISSFTLANRGDWVKLRVFASSTGTQITHTNPDVSGCIDMSAIATSSGAFKIVESEGFKWIAGTIANNDPNFGWGYIGLPDGNDPCTDGDSYNSCIQKRALIPSGTYFSISDVIPEYIGIYTKGSTTQTLTASLGDIKWLETENLDIGDMTNMSAKWMVNRFLIVIGSGLGVLVTLLPYILLIVAIIIIVYFAFKGFRFTK
jgi:hypothetical protein